MKQRFSLAWKSVLVLTVFSVATAWAAPPRCVIVLIGDGMGFEQVKAAGMYLNGTPGTLSFEGLPYQGQMTTYSASSSITDSAAAATAIATGYKVNNGVISIATPGDGHELTTQLEIFRDLDYRTGLVTTCYVTHATPAGFGAHETNRSNYTAIGRDYLNQTLPNVLLGGCSYLIDSEAIAAGYTIIENRSELQDPGTPALSYISGQFGSGYMPYEYDYYLGTDTGYDTLPHLSEMTETALDTLDDNPDGFFLMVEGGRIDHAGHDNNLPRNIFETIEFSYAVQKVIDWASGRTDTLILVTADHETGGLTVLTNNGAGQLPTVSWSTGGHTGVPVPVYAWGVNADLVGGTIDNTDIIDIVFDAPAIACNPTSFSTSVNKGSNPASDSLTVWNDGIHTLNYTATVDAGWLSVSPASGSSTGETDTLQVLYNTASLLSGTYEATITLSDPAAREPAFEIPVTLTVLGPNIALNKTAINRTVVFTQDLSASTFTVANDGGATLYYNISEEVDWLDVSPTSGDSTGEADTIQITYTTNNLPVGQHVAEITVSSPEAMNTPRTLTVTVDVIPIKGDLDHDNDSDMEDFALFQVCLSGAGIAQTDPACSEALLDGDTDVDGTDLDLFVNCMTGADIPVDPTCIP